MHVNVCRNFYRLKLCTNIFNKKSPSLFTFSNIEIKRQKTYSLCAYFDNLILKKVVIRPLFVINQDRKYAKKKKHQPNVIAEEESESEDDENVNSEGESDEQGIVSRAVMSLRADNVLKAALNITKKKIEKDFYESNIRVNGEKLLKKSLMQKVMAQEIQQFLFKNILNNKILEDMDIFLLKLHQDKSLKDMYSRFVDLEEGDEADLVKGASPDSENLLIVDRVILKSIGRVNESGNSIYIKVQILKSLLIENYPDRWVPSKLN